MIAWRVRSVQMPRFSRPRRHRQIKWIFAPRWTPPSTRGLRRRRALPLREGDRRARLRSFPAEKATGRRLGRVVAYAPGQGSSTFFGEAARVAPLRLADPVFISPPSSKKSPARRYRLHDPGRDVGADVGASPARRVGRAAGSDRRASLRRGRDRIDRDLGRVVAEFGNLSSGGVGRGTGSMSSCVQVCDVARPCASVAFRRRRPPSDSALEQGRK
jgi:hypothetical protein